MANYHVVKSKDSGDWVVKKAGSERRSGPIHETQRSAEKAAKQYAAKSGGGEVRIHNSKGQIRDSVTVRPGNDPNPPRDKKH